MNSERLQRALPALGLFFISLFLFTLGLRHQEIIGFESRFYLFALEMWRHGITGFPTTYSVPYPDYPVTTTLFIYGVAKCLGQLDKLAAVLPSAIAAAVTVSFTYLIGALHHLRWGFLAVCFLLMTNTFLMEARTISPDQFVVMVTVIAFYVVYSASLFQRYGRLLSLPILFLLGFACRGPIGLVVPAGVVCVFYLLEKDYKRFFLMGFMAAVLLSLSCALLLALAYHVGGQSFVHDVIRMEVIGRLQNEAQLPVYFYLVESIGAYAVTYPLAILVMFGLRGGSPRDYRFCLKLVAWVVLILVGLSVPTGKKVRYVLAFAPALALLTAYLFEKENARFYILYLRKAVYGLFFSLPMVCLIAFVCSVDMRNAVSSVVWFVLGLSVLQVVSVIARKQVALVMASAALTFVMTYAMVVEPVNERLNRTYAFVTAVEQMRLARGAALVFYDENPDALPIKYRVNMSRDELPIFITQPDQVLQFKGAAVFIANEEKFAKLQKVLGGAVQRIDSGRVGRESVVVFVRP